jgi:hypothetical protein
MGRPRLPGLCQIARDLVDLPLNRQMTLAILFAC